MEAMNPQGKKGSTLRRWQGTVRRPQKSGDTIRKSIHFAQTLDARNHSPDANVIHKGYLLMQVPVYNGMGTKWRKRYCKIHDGLYPTLTVQSHAEDELPDVSIPLDDATIRRPNRKNNTGVSHLFEIKNQKYSPTETYIFAMLPTGDEAEVIKLWMGMIKQAAVQSENKARCKLLEESLTEKELLEMKAKELALLQLTRAEVEEMSRQLQLEEEHETKRLQEEYAKLKSKMVDILSDRFNAEFHNLGKVVPHNIHDSQSPLQKPWSVLVGPPSL